VALNFGQTEEEKEMAKDLLEFMNDKIEKEKQADGLAGETQRFEGSELSQEALDTLEELYIKESGYHL